MNEVYQAVHAAIKTKIPAKRKVGDEVVITNRDEILEAVPFYVKRAVLKLQEEEIMPPRLYTVNTGDEKQTYVDKNGKECFSYIGLPENFASLFDFQVEDESDVWSRYDNEYKIEKVSKLKEDNLYKVLKLDFAETGEHQDVLVLSPYPTNSNIIYIKYFISGSEEFLNLIDEKYWNAIISKVEFLIGIGSKQEAEDDAYNASQRRVKSTKLGDRRRTASVFFGRTTSHINRRV